MLCDGVGVWPLVSDPQGIRESPWNIDSNITTTWVETQTTNQWPYDHGRWPEANAGEQYKQGPDRLLRLYDANSTDNNLPRKERPALAGTGGTM